MLGEAHSVWTAGSVRPCQQEFELVHGVWSGMLARLLAVTSMGSANSMLEHVAMHGAVSRVRMPTKHLPLVAEVDRRSTAQLVPLYLTQVRVGGRECRAKPVLVGGLLHNCHTVAFFLCCTGVIRSGDFPSNRGTQLHTTCCQTRVAAVKRGQPSFFIVYGMTGTLCFSRFPPRPARQHGGSAGTNADLCWCAFQW